MVIGDCKWVLFVNQSVCAAVCLEMIVTAAALSDFIQFNERCQTLYVKSHSLISLTVDKPGRVAQSVGAPDS